MKRLLLLNFFLLALMPVQAHSAPIQITATEVITASFGNFSATAGGTPLDGDTAIQSIIASDPTTAIFGSSSTTYSVIELGFGDNTAITGAGDDLQIFSLWSGYSYSFGLNVYGLDSAVNPISSFYYSVDCPVGESGVCASDILSTSINLSNADGYLDNNIEISYIELFIGGTDYNGSIGGLDAYSNFSMVNSYYSDQIVVPLPLSVVLFSSGLAMLGLVGRRKTR